MRKTKKSKTIEIFKEMCYNTLVNKNLTEKFMASGKKYLELVLRQCSGLSARAMMAEYVLYYADKVVGGYRIIVCL